MSQLQIVAIAFSAGLLLVILELVRRRRLLERYALLWLAVGVALVLLGAWRGLLTRLSDLVGIAAPANALFAAGFVLLIALVLNFSVAVSRLTDQSKILAQRIGLLEERLRERPPEPGAEETEAAPEAEAAGAPPRERAPSG
jgi:hypothetical protein